MDTQNVLSIMHYIILLINTETQCYECGGIWRSGVVVYGDGIVVHVVIVGIGSGIMVYGHGIVVLRWYMV